ncbi:flavoprotein, partial [Azospirillum sp. TSO22-1]|uniref:flavoprotein n=1 Tax=Azospirillum sp. TSO22-1 TaxID=716789 RepID=UPI000D60E301
LFERGPAVGASLRAWAHVRVFSPWRYNVDAAARTLLEATGWTAPDDEALPTGGGIVRDYLEPLAAHPGIAPHLRLGAEVLGITRSGLDKLTTSGRADAPLVVSWRDRDGTEHRTAAHAVIDASGTWFTPNPMGVDGLPVPGERAAADRIAYGIPDVLGAERETYAGVATLVVGSGHSAMNAVLDLLTLREQAPGTRVLWALRRNQMARLLGGGLNDQLPARGALGVAATRAIAEGRLELLSPYAAERVERAGDGLRITGALDGRPHEMRVQRVIVATGLRPNLSILRELRVELDPLVEAPPKLAPLIDPNLHSCGTVPPHGVEELSHPEPGFYIVGGKSYGRAPTFLMATGYEQVRSVVAEIAGDHVAARDVHLVLPETGVCSSDALFAEEEETAGGCCGTPAPAPAAPATPAKATGCCTRVA